MPIRTWYAQDCDIHTHPKTTALAKALSLDIDTAVGKLGRLWGWAGRTESESGDISHLPHEEIAAIMRWKKSPEILMTALVENGFIDAGDGSLKIHDWDEINGKMIAKKRGDRARKFRGNSTEIPRKS